MSSDNTKKKPIGAKKVKWQYRLSRLSTCIKEMQSINQKWAVGDDICHHPKVAKLIALLKVAGDLAEGQSDRRDSDEVIVGGVIYFTSGGRIGFLYEGDDVAIQADANLMNTAAAVSKEAVRLQESQERKNKRFRDRIERRNAAISPEGQSLLDTLGMQLIREGK